MYSLNTIEMDMVSGGNAAAAGAIGATGGVSVTETIGAAVAADAAAGAEAGSAVGPAGLIAGAIIGAAIGIAIYEWA